MAAVILASWTPLQTQRIVAGMQIAEGFHYAVQRLVGLVRSGSAPLIIHDGPCLSWLCLRVRRYALRSHLPPLPPSSVCSNSPGGMCPAHSCPPTDKIVSRHGSHSCWNGRGTSALMSALLSIYAAPAEPRKKCHLLPGTEGAVFLPLASRLQFIFVSFIFLGERLFANIIAKWGTGGQAKSLLSSNPLSPFWMWAPTETAAPISIPLYAATTFHSVFCVCRIQRPFDNFPFAHCPYPSSLPFPPLVMLLCFFVLFSLASPRRLPYKMAFPLPALYLLSSAVALPKHATT